MRALIVEDESRIARNLQRALETVPSFAADVLGDGLEAWERLSSGEPYDLLLLDRMLPGMDGLDLLRRLRESGSRLPVLVLTALGTKEDIIQGLDYGCDDYLVKPYDTGELLARCKALVRRSQEHPAPVLEVADLRVDTRTHAVARGGRRIELPALEYRLLEYLAFRPGAVISKTELLEHLYDYNWEKFSNVIEHYVWSLRSKLEARGEARLLHTVRGVGYGSSEGPETVTRRPPTLFLRLLLLTLPVECIVLALFGVWLVRGSERREAAAFDDRLRLQSQAVLSGVGLDPAGRLKFDAGLNVRALASDTNGCILDEGGAVLWESPKGWFEASDIRGLSQADVEFVHTITVKGVGFRVIQTARRIHKPEDTEVATGPLAEVVLAKPITSLDGANLALREKAVAVGVALLALMALLLWLAIGVGLKPVEAMIRKLPEVPGPSGTERLDEGRVPKELAPLAREINGLLDRLWGLVQLEKRFTAEAAHELRTPLTLVKSTLQTTLLTAHGPEDYAKGPPGGPRGPPAPGDDRRIAPRPGASRRALLEPAASPMPTSICRTSFIPFRNGSRQLPSRWVRGWRWICNRARYVESKVRWNASSSTSWTTPSSIPSQGGRSPSGALPGTEAVVAAVEDTGSPVPEAERAHLFEQFFRGSSGRAAGVQGAGLGLSIASAMARLHGAELTYEQWRPQWQPLRREVSKGRERGAGSGKQVGAIARSRTPSAYVIPGGSSKGCRAGISPGPCRKSEILSARPFAGALRMTNIRSGEQGAGSG